MTFYLLNPALQNVVLAGIRYRIDYRRMEGGGSPLILEATRQDTDKRLNLA